MFSLVTSGPEKPERMTLYSPCLRAEAEIGKEGFLVWNAATGTDELKKLHHAIHSMDEPAEKLLTNFKASGWGGTLHCDVIGEHAKTVTGEDSSTAVYYSEAASCKAKLRTSKDWQAAVKKIQDGFPMDDNFPVKGPSVLTDLNPDIELPKDVAIESMHKLDKGVNARILSVILSSSKNQLQHPNNMRIPSQSRTLIIKRMQYVFHPSFCANPSSPLNFILSNSRQKFCLLVFFPRV